MFKLVAFEFLFRHCWRYRQRCAITEADKGNISCNYLLVQTSQRSNSLHPMGSSRFLLNNIVVLAQPAHEPEHSNQDHHTFAGRAICPLFIKSK